MPEHWTYSSEQKDDSIDLTQGDIIGMTDDFRKVVQEIHPYFDQSKYIAFLVTTQSCDLVRRNGRACQTDYINLAAVRTLAEVIPRLVRSVCQPFEEGIYNKRDKEEAKRLLERLFNQNEQKIGLFYLHPDYDNTGILEGAVAFLRVTITLQSNKHYDTLLNSRCGSLTPTFQNKLGWLSGNLFSRIGVQDWNKEELARLTKKSLDSCPCLWTNEETYYAAQEKGEKFIDKSIQEQEEILKRNQPEPYKNILAQAAAQQSESLLKHIIEEIESSLTDDLFMQNKKDIISEIIKNKLQKTPTTLANRLKNDPVFAQAYKRNSL